MMTRRFFGVSCYWLVFVMAAIAGCGGGGTSPKLGPSGSSSGSGAFLAAITPAPGIPTVPPASWTPNPNATPPTPLPSSSPTITLGTQTFSADQIFSTSSPLPIEQALADDGESAIQNALIEGNVAGFTQPNGIVVTVVPDVQVDPSSAPIDELGTIPQTQTLQVTGHTYDGVPGGFGHLHVGDPIMAGIEGTGSAGIADFVFALPGAASLAVPTSAERSMGDVSSAGSAVVAPSAVERSRSKPFLSGQVGTSYTPFSMGAQYPAANQKAADQKFNFPTYCFNPPLPFPIGVCVIPEPHLVIGNIANFPMGLVDETSRDQWVLDEVSTIPIAIDPESGSASTNNKIAHYSFNAYGSITFHVKATVLNKVYGRDFTFINGLRTLTTDDLPATGQSLPLTVFQTFTGDFDVLPFVCAAAKVIKTPYAVALAAFCNSKLSKAASIPIHFAFKVQDTISGGNIKVGALSITNASPGSAQNLLFNISGDVPPNFKAAPGPQATPNVFTISGLTYTGKDNPELEVDLTLGQPGATTSLTENPTFPLSQLPGYPSTSVLQVIHEFPTPVQISICPSLSSGGDNLRRLTAPSCPAPTPTPTPTPTPPATGQITPPTPNPSASPATMLCAQTNISAPQPVSQPQKNCATGVTNPSDYSTAPPNDFGPWGYPTQVDVCNIQGVPASVLNGFACTWPQSVTVQVTEAGNQYFTAFLVQQDVTPTFLPPTDSCQNTGLGDITVSPSGAAGANGAGASFVITQTTANYSPSAYNTDLCGVAVWDTHNQMVFFTVGQQFAGGTPPTSIRRRPPPSHR